MGTPLAGFQVATLRFQGWSGKQNGELIRLIDGRIDAFLTGDKNLQYQQRIETRQIAIIELPFIRLQSLDPDLDPIRPAIRNWEAGDCIQVK